jgi:hypothetical protein
MMNRPSYGWEHKFRTFEEIFPEPEPPKPKTDLVKLKAACRARKMNLIEVPKDA